jgi:hypothetical protein
MANVAQKTPVHWEVLFEGMTDSFIPLIKVVPEFHTSDDYAEKWNTLTLDYDFHYLWEKVDDKNYKLYIRLSGELKKGITVLPLFADLSLWVINTNYKDSIQHCRGY